MAIVNNYIKYSSPNIEIKFTSVAGDEFVASSYEFGGIIISLKTNKTINQMPGTFEITTVGKNEFNDFLENIRVKASGWELFRTSGIVDININSKQIMIGKIDSISKNVAIDNRGRPVRNWVIAGRDLGSFLIDHKIWYDDIVYKNREKQNTMMGALSSFGMVGNESSGEIIQKVINNWMIDVINKNIEINGTTIQPYSFSDGTRIQDKFKAILVNQNTFVTNESGSTIEGPGAISDNSYADEYPINFAMSFVGGALYNFLQNVTAEPFNEFFVDTGDRYIDTNIEERKYLKKDSVYVIFRPTPFDDGNFDIEGVDSKLKMENLITYSIDDSIIRQKQLNQNKNQRYGVYYVSPSNETLGFVQGKFYTPGEYDEEAIRRYGYSTLNVKLGGYEVSQHENGQIESLVSNFQKKLKSWFQKSDRFLNGAFIIKGNENVRIGSKLLYERDEFGNIEDDYEEGYYYIIGVNHNWMYNKEYNTTINVIRGISKRIFKKEQKNEVANSNQITILKLG